MSTLNPAATAARSKTPFRRPVQPSPRAVDTSKSTNSRESACATDSSRRILKIQYSLSRHGQNANRLLAADRRERIQKVFECVAGFEVIEEVGNRDPRPDEHQLSAHDLRIAVDDVSFRHWPRIPRIIRR